MWTPSAERLGAWVDWDFLLMTVDVEFSVKILGQTLDQAS
jgi:hypothetical protein